MKKFLLSLLILMIFFLTSRVSAQPISIRLVDSITGKITVSFENIEPVDAVKMVADMKNFTLEYKNLI